MAQLLEVPSVSIAFTVANAIGFIPMIIGGRINDRIGPKWLIFASGLIFSLGMFCSGFATTPSTLIITYGLGVGMGIGYGCTIANSVKFFPDKRGLIGGLTTASYGISSVIIPPVANLVNSSLGVRVSFHLFGGVFGLMIISCASSIGQNMVGLAPAMAAFFVSILALFNTAGRIAAGMLSDKIGRINTISIAVVISIAGLGLLYRCGTGTVSLYLAGVALIGLCFGTFMGVFPGFTADQFGPKHDTANYGIMWIGFNIAGIVGPTIVSAVYLRTGTYQGAFAIAGILAIAGPVLTFVYRTLNRQSLSASPHRAARNNGKAGEAERHEGAFFSGGSVLSAG